VPSGTSRYYSVTVGLVHFIALDLNMYACELLKPVLVNF
jgi:hypothetical protein